MPRNINEIIEHADELAKQFEDFDPTDEQVAGSTDLRDDANGASEQQ